MANARVKIDYRKVGDMTRPLIEERVHAIAARAGDGFKGSVIQTDRPHGAVYATTFKARRRNARDNTLLKAVQG